MFPLSPAERLQILRDHLFGVDLDPAAILDARARLRDRILGTAASFPEVELALETNLRCGDALLGRGLHEASDATEASATQPGTFDSDAAPDPLDWRQAFPAVAADGGFDVVIGNPPYLREKNGKELFDRIAGTRWGRHWRQARMDLWFYFLHRGLDLLKPGGTLSYIVNSYWTASAGAGRLIERLAAETRLQEVVLLGSQDIFPDVAGRHLILRLVRRESSASSDATEPRRPETPCRVISLAEVPDALQALEQLGRSARSTATALSPGATYVIKPSQLFQQGRLILEPPDPRDALFRHRTPLQELFETRQGLAENPPWITKGHCQEFPGRFALGEGVFVLTPAEVEGLQLSAAEQLLLRPYYETRTVGRYILPQRPTHQVLYLTERTAPNLDGSPQIAAHLERFRPLLDRRRETQCGVRAWWQLHWPREERVFMEPRIVCVQMGRVPQAVYVERPAFFGFSINLILARAEPSFPLEVLTGILNSQLAAHWFSRHAKRRGVNLEINGGVLQQFPLPERDRDVEDELLRLVRQRHITDESSSLDCEVDRLVETLYGQPREGS